MGVHEHADTSKSCAYVEYNTTLPPLWHATDVRFGICQPPTANKPNQHVGVTLHVQLFSCWWSPCRSQHVANNGLVYTSKVAKA